MLKNPVNQPITLNLQRDQILARLWQLANLSPEQTRCSISGQIKAMSMIVAIEGLITDRRLTPARAPAETAVEQQPPTRQAPPPNLARHVLAPSLGHSSLDNPFNYPEATNRVPPRQGPPTMPTSTRPATSVSACPKKALVRAAAKLTKRPNFIELYQISPTTGAL